MEVTEKGYVALAQGCSRLQVLRMYACAHVNDTVLRACGEFLPELNVIDICGAHLVTDSGAKVSMQCMMRTESYTCVMVPVNFVMCMMRADSYTCVMVPVIVSCAMWYKPDAFIGFTC